MKKHCFRRGIVLLLCALLCTAMPLGVLAAEITEGETGELDDALTVEVQPDAPEVSDEEQTLVLSIKFSETVVINAISAENVLVPADWTVTVQGVGYTLESGDTEDHLLSVGYDKNTKKIAGAYSDEDSYRHIHGLRLTYTVPAGAAGSFALGVEDLWLGTISAVMVIDGVDATKTVVIKALQPGDLDGDGAIGAGDAVGMLRFVCGLQVEAPALALDVNGDKTADYRDALLLFRMAAGQSTAPVSGATPAVRRVFAGLYDENGRMLGVCAIGSTSAACADLDAILREADRISVFYLSDAFIPVTDSSLFSLGNN